MTNLLTKLEVDVMQGSELKQVVDLVTKYGLPSIVVNPSFYTDANLLRMSRRGRFKIVVPVDWPKGEQFCRTKLRGITNSSLEADGFEVLLTPGRSEADTRAEAKYVDDIIHGQVNQFAEVRFVLWTHEASDERIITAAKGIGGLRTPDYLRLDTQLKSQISKGNAEQQARVAGLVRAAAGNACKLKASGNFNSTKALVACPWASRFAVNLQQLTAVLKDLERQPDSLKELLA